MEDGVGNVGLRGGVAGVFPAKEEEEEEVGGAGCNSSLDTGEWAEVLVARRRRSKLLMRIW